MMSSRLFVVILLFLGAITIREISAKKVTEKSPKSPESNIKGRLLTPEEGCGYSKVANTKIVGGTAAKIGAFPWIGLLGYNESFFYSFKCGASLITSRHVLTAAHCIEGNLEIVRLGEHEMGTRVESRQDIEIAKIEKHRGYDSLDGKYDIAILTLVRDVEFSDRIRPICLPIYEPNLKKRFVGSNPFIAGWGTTKHKGKRSNVLMQAQVPILKNQVCKDAFRKVGLLVHENQFNSVVLCAGDMSGRKDACQGDSGGPLMLPIHDHGKFPFYQIGIVAYGHGCAEGIPGVYTRIQHFADWIKDKLGVF